MAFQEERHEDAPVPLAKSEESSTIEQAPQTPAPTSSEQFEVPEPTLLNAHAESVPLNADAETASLTSYSTTPYPAPGQTVLPPQQPPRRRRLGTTAIVAICLTILLIILGGGGLIYDLAYYQPHQAQVNANAQATGTVNAMNSTTTSFSATDTAQQTATVQAYMDLYQQATAGQPVLNDPLNQQGNGDWDVFQQPDKSGACGFQNGSYHASIINASVFQPCYENANSFSNFAVQVDMTIVTGDEGGIVFRADSTKGLEYLLTINAHGQYHLYIYTGFSAGQSRSILDNVTDYMNRSGPTTITLIARGGTFYLFLNAHFVFSTTDTALTSGLVGVVANDQQHSTDVAFQNAKVWIL